MTTTSAYISLSEVLSALSHALDLTGGQPAGHTLRACMIGTRLADAIGLGPADRSALYYALLLKDAGCSSNAARFAELFGTSDHQAKRHLKAVDIHRRVRLAFESARTVARGSGSLADRLRRLRGLADTPDAARELIEVRCDRGAAIALQMGFPAATADAIRSLDEHWCGRGYPDGLAGEEIPLLARVVLLAQTMEIFFTLRGPSAALRVATERRGRWFDPRLVDVVRTWKNDRAWWHALSDPDLASAVVALEPPERVQAVDETQLDVVARAFADIIDAKSPFTFHHSANVAGYARDIGRAVGLGPVDQRRLYRAGLLHDIGKLGVSNHILDSPGRLSDEQRVEVERHPTFTWNILSRVRAFDDFAWLAATHHEKLDGSGYPWRLTGAQLDLPARVLVVADIYEALTADRPYRAGMPVEKALGILRSEAGTKLCPEAVAGLERSLAGGAETRAA
jgi:putative nucleotidyltransferase with HDIG domain